MKKSIGFTVDADPLLREATQHYLDNGLSNSPGMVMGLDMIRRGLGLIAERALELQDERLMDLCKDLGALKPSPPSESTEP